MVSVYIKEKRRPSKELKNHFEVPSKIAEDMKNLRKEMKYEKRTETVLILSFVSDDMIRAVSMFLDVYYMDVTCSTN